ncbi:MAG: peptidoglycan DD-metalloendopeptidase family protein [Desulfobulbaceae bacterium]|nr:peptidoglycan DD-metalloendopeptidase family protein [Desulfobulbaceae bacterium]
MPMHLACPGSKIRNFLIVAIGTLALIPPIPALAEQNRPSSNDRLRQVEEQLDSHHEKIKESHIKALNLEQEMHRIDSQIAKGQKNLQELQEKSRRQEEAISNKEDEINLIVAEKDVRAAHIKKRLAGLYQSGEVGIINALFSASDLGDLLNLQEYVQALFKYDKQVTDEFKRQIELLAQAKEALAKAKADLEALITQAEEGEKSLRASREERDQLLAQVRTEVELHRQATQALQDAATKLTTTIEQERARELKAARQKKSRRLPKTKPTRPVNTGFLADKGRMPPPAIGQITRVFGPYQDPFGNGLRSDGIDIDVPPGTPVTAMHSGRVIFADTMPGYGNLIIIDHDSQYYTLTSGLASLSRAKDDIVSTGDVIGVFDQAPGLITPGLHVEIRHGSTPEDPLPWLDTSQLEIVR